jgi:hypothetical protein
MFSLIHTILRKDLLLSITLAFLLTGVLSAQARVKQVQGPETVAGRTGIIYSLPRTVLVADLEFTRTDRIPGPYHAFAGELLGIEQVVEERSVSYTLDHASVTAYTEPDPEHIYLIEMDEKSEEAVLLEFAANGLMLGSKTTLPDEQVTMKWIGEPSGQSYDLNEIFPVYREASLKEVIDTITRVVTFDTLTYTEKILKRLMILQSEREKAAEASTLIHDIGQDQYTLLVGYQETAYSHDAIKYMHDQLESQRRNYLQLFTGVTRKERMNARFFILPDAGMMEEPFRLAGFSEVSGLIAVTGSDDVLLTIEASGVAEKIGSASPPVAGASGYYYRIPETCEVSILFDGEMMARENIIINQAGVVRNLPPGVTDVGFDAVTGGIKRVVFK